MRTWAHWTAKTVMLTAGVVAAGAGFSGVAFAASPGGSGGAGAVTSGLGSVLGGNQASAPVSLPVDVCGNAAAVLGLSLAGCGGGASSASSAGPASATGGTGGLGSAGVTRGAGSVAGGNQVSAPVSAPVSACGNEAGHAAAHCGGGATVTWSGSPRGTTARTSGRGSVAGGNQFNAPVTTPVSVCGNAAAVLGDSAAGCEGSASAGSAAGRTFADAPDTGLAPGRSGGNGRGRGRIKPRRRYHREPGRARDHAGGGLAGRPEQHLDLQLGHRSCGGRRRRAEDGGAAFLWPPQPGPPGLTNPRTVSRAAPWARSRHGTARFGHSVSRCS